MADETNSVQNQIEDKYNTLIDYIRKNAQCTKCNNTPAPDDLYQCSTGHLLCELCILELLVKEQFEKKEAQCPICKVRIIFDELSYNIAIRHTLWELPHKCEQCDGLFIRKELELHMKDKCMERPSKCKNRCIGCLWSGPLSQLAEHEGTCKYPQMGAMDIVKSMRKLNKLENHKYHQSNKIYKCLSWERYFNDDIFLCVHFFEENNHIKFVSSRFYTFDESWTLNVRINDCLNNLESGGIENVLYSLERRTRFKHYPFKIKFYVASSPTESRNIMTRVHRHVFNALNFSTGYKKLDIQDSKQRNRLLVQKQIRLRLYMFYKS